MKILVIKDSKVSYEKLQTAFRNLKGIYQTNTGISINFITEEEDLSKLPYTTYNHPPDPNIIGIDQKWIKTRCEQVFDKWKEEIDLVIFLVHEDNWKPGLDGRKVWGWNISTVFSGYQVEQCRYDKDNEANTVGVMYHEIMHSHDSFIFSYLGYWIHSLVGVTDWDRDVVHGSSPKWSYIRYNENQPALKAIAEPLRQAFIKRREIFDKRVGQMKTIINLLQQTIVLMNTIIAERRKKDLPLIGKE